MNGVGKKTAKYLYFSYATSVFSLDCCWFYIFKTKFLNKIPFFQKSFLQKPFKSATSVFTHLLNR